MVAAEELDLTYLEDRFAGDISDVVSGERMLVDALMALHGWSGSPPATVSGVASQFGLTPDALRSANRKFEDYARANVDTRIEEAVDDIAGNLPFPLPLFGDWMHDNGYTQLASFPIEAFLDAADIYEVDLPFRALSTTRTKWLVAPDDPGVDAAFADEVVDKVLKVVTHWGIIDVNHFDSILSAFDKAEDHDHVWAMIDASPELTTVSGTGLVVARRPREDARIVLRLDRLLAFMSAVPLEIVLKQITRDGREGVLPVCDTDTLEAFIRACAYYDIEDGDVVSNRNLVVDEELSARETPVVLALVEKPTGATVSELAASIPGPGGDALVREMVATSPLIAALPGDRYALLDESMYDALVANATVSAPQPTATTTPVETNVVDLAKLGHTGKYWWAMYAGPIPQRNLEGARKREQEYIPIIEPGTGRCLGMVRTSRVYNKKYRGGTPSVLANDKGLTGKELPRIVSRASLLEALSEAPFVFYNNPAKSGQDSWGIVLRQDIGWG